jgi:septal ring factor EnvC (AmiA/AmiB activator)
MDINGAKHTNDDDALREAIRISELESKAARAAAAAQAAAEAAIAAAKEAAAMQAEAEAAMTEARKSRETLAKQGSEVHVPLAAQTEDTRGPTAPPPPPGRPPGEQGTACRNRRTYDTKGCRIFRGGV